MLDALCKIALGVVERWVRLLFLSPEASGAEQLFIFFQLSAVQLFPSIEKNKVLYLGKKQVPIAWAEPLERWQSVGRAGQKSQRSVPISFF